MEVMVREERDLERKGDGERREGFGEEGMEGDGERREGFGEEGMEGDGER